jgi:cellulose synthase/poly-beta-1,6-N-acetylglucosamine synthase-like glycosyltransferase
MLLFIVLFWLLLFLVFYTYLGYGMLLFFVTRTRRLLGIRYHTESAQEFEPEVTLFVAAYNEREALPEKMKNSAELNYPPEKLKFVWVTDGSDDGTPELLGHYDHVEVFHEAQRNGKIGAMNRGIKFVNSPIVVFSDANTMLSETSIRRIVNLFRDPKVGCVSGEKRIYSKDKDAAVGSGESLYWKYESALKKWDAELCSVVGAAGELFAIRTHLYQQLEPDTLLDDFMISMRIAEQGYRIEYDPEAYAIEAPSATIREELKRKIRIAAGGLQSVVRLRSLLNIFKFGTLSFQYISHRVLRWTLAPISLLLLVPLGLLLALNEGIFGFGIYSLLFWAQVAFYLTAFAGWFLEERSIRIKLVFIPYYFLIMNLSVFLGFQRLLTGKQSVNWARAKRGI